MSGRLDEHLVKALANILFFLEEVEEEMNPDDAAKVEDLIAYEISLMSKVDQIALAEEFKKIAASSNDRREKVILGSLPRSLGLGEDDDV